MDLRHVVSISGGKDSTALWLLAVERGVDCIPVFADTGHEHEQTYDYLDYLTRVIGPIRTIKADFSRRFEVRRKNLPDLWASKGVPASRIERALELLHPTGNPFLDVCMLKGRFPSSRRRFCSQELKHLPIRAQVVDPLMDEGCTVVSWQGIRADESRARAHYDVVEEFEEQLISYRPIITWTYDDVFAQHRKHGIRWNPLYEQGMSRVGCMPCIHARKDELREIAERFPDEIARIREWERIVSEVSPYGLSTLFAYDKTADPKTYGLDNPCANGIDTVVEWSKTTRGGKQFDLLAMPPDLAVCSSIYGLCE